MVVYIVYKAKFCDVINGNVILSNKNDVFLFHCYLHRFLGCSFIFLLNSSELTIFLLSTLPLVLVKTNLKLLQTIFSFALVYTFIVLSNSSSMKYSAIQCLANNFLLVSWRKRNCLRLAGSKKILNGSAELVLAT